jgi:chemotaxis protein CheC
MKDFTPLEIDTLTEIINIGIGRAASALNDITGSHIQLKVPSIALVLLDALPKTFQHLENDLVSSVMQSFQGDFTGSAALLFPPESAARLVSVITKEEITAANLDTVRSGTLMEIGNIIINSLLGTMCNIFECSLSFSLPEYRDAKGLSDLIESSPTLHGEAGMIMLVEATFLIKTLRISGYILVIFRLESTEVLRAMIARIAQK